MDMGIVEGFMDWNIEVLLLSEHMALLSRIKAREPACKPRCGLLTIDQKKVEMVTALAQEYVRGIISFENLRDIGSLRKL